MKTAFSFYKMEASANDFIVVDNRGGLVKDAKKFTREMCDRHRGIGADGVLLIEPSKRADFRMRILNADGSEAEMCGNGSRCAALFAVETLGFPSRFSIETLAGMISAKTDGSTVKVRLYDPRDYRPESELKVDGKPYRYYFINTGVPHAVLFVKDLKNFPVEVIGEKIRFHKNFQPAGTNVNFVQVTGKKTISVRTFERGVGETQACGTGVTASAIVSSLAGKCRPPVQVTTLGGEKINVYFDRDGQKVFNVHMEGRAHFVYKGEYIANSK